MQKKIFLYIITLWLLTSCSVKNNYDKVLTILDKKESDSTSQFITEINDDFFMNELYDEKNSTSDTLKFKHNEKPIIIDFYAPWFTPWVKSKSYYENLSKLYGDKIVFYRINTDKNNRSFFLLSTLVKRNGVPLFIFINTKDEIDYLDGWNANFTPKFFSKKINWLLNKD